MARRSVAVMIEPRGWGSCTPSPSGPASWASRLSSAHDFHLLELPGRPCRHCDGDCWIGRCKRRVLDLREDFHSGHPIVRTMSRRRTQRALTFGDSEGTCLFKVHAAVDHRCDSIHTIRETADIKSKNARPNASILFLSISRERSDYWSMSQCWNSSPLSMNTRPCSVRVIE